jgi:hypothetical protein
MNKKYVSYVIITVLCLNLFPQKNSAFVLNEIKDNLIYENEEEKDAWETFYLPYAKHLKLVNKTTTMLDIAKDFEKEARDNPQGYTIVHKIMNRTYYERNKLIVKWERDNGYIAKEVEEERNITPIKRFQLLTEIEEEEEREKEKTYNSRFRGIKTLVSVAAAGFTFGREKHTEKDIKEVFKSTALACAAVSAVVNIAEVTLSGTWNTIRRLWNGEEEIKLPPLRNMPVLPKDYKRVDVYRYGL